MMQKQSLNVGRFRAAQETLNHIVPRHLRESIADGKGCEWDKTLGARDGAKEVLAT